MSPVDPAADAYALLFESFQQERHRPLLEVNLDSLSEMHEKLCNVPNQDSEDESEDEPVEESEHDESIEDESDDESDISVREMNYNRFRIIMFTQFLQCFARELNTPTPNWKKVLNILHSMWCGFPAKEESIAFWGISDADEENQRESFETLACEQYSDDLIQSNQTGVTLERIMMSYSIVITMCRLDSMLNSTLTVKAVHMFINQLYFDDYFNRNELVKIENETIPFSLYNEDDEYYFHNGGSPAFDFEPEDYMPVF